MELGLFIYLFTVIHLVDNMTTKVALNKINVIYYIQRVTALLVLESACLTPDHKVAGSIPGTLTILNVYKVWNGVHPAS